MRQLQRAAAVGAADARRPARPHRVDEVLQLEPQRLGLLDVQLAAVDGRPGGAQHDLIELGFLLREVDADVGARLEEAHLADGIEADAAGGEVGDATRREREADVGDVDARRQHRHADRLDGRDLGADGREQHVEVVDHQVEHDVDVEAALAEAAEAVHLDEAGRLDVRQRGGHRRVEALGVADREHRAVPRRQRDQAVGLLERARHRLLDQHRHAARQERPGQLGVQLGRRGDRRRRRPAAAPRRRRRPGCRARRQSRRRGPRRDRRHRPASRRASRRGCGRGACPDARRRRRRRAACVAHDGTSAPDVAAWR